MGNLIGRLIEHQWAHSVTATRGRTLICLNCLREIQPLDLQYFFVDCPGYKNLGES